MSSTEKKPIGTQPPDPLKPDSGGTGTKPRKEQSVGGSGPADEEEEEE